MKPGNQGRWLKLFECPPTLPGLLGILCAGAYLASRLFSEAPPRGETYPPFSPQPTGSTMPGLTPPSEPASGSQPPAFNISRNQNTPRKRSWDPGFLNSLRGLARGQPIQFALTGGQTASGTIGHLRSIRDEMVYVSGRLDQPEPGRFFFQKQSGPGVAGDFVGVVEFPAGGRAWRLEPTGPRGSPELVERPLGSVLCVGLPRPTGETIGQVRGVPPLRPGDFPELLSPPYQNGIPVLESLPGSKGVIYLDFQGGYTAAWGGIEYEKPSVSSAQIRDVWVRLAEDLMPFNLNLTTDLRTFESAPENSRQRVIVTPTTTAGPEFGGVSYVGSFNWSGDIPCWVFILSGKSCAEAAAHEIGHALGLGHQGRNGTNTTEYFLGHGFGETAWAPIMGAGYYRNISQWSRGEYELATNPEDELTLITTQNNSLGFRPDDTGETLATSRHLELYPQYTAGAEGVIERSGDTDAFQFTTRGGQISLRADPVTFGPNLALRVALHDANGVLLTSAEPRDTLWASLDTLLPAGTYTFRVSGAGRGDPRTDGFSAYGSLGYFSVTGFVANARLPVRLAVREAATNGTAVGRIPPFQPTASPPVYTIVSGNRGSTFGIDPSGTLYVATNSLLDYVALGRGSQFPVQFELFVNINHPAEPSLNETNRRVVVAVLSELAPPTITRQPEDATVLAGTNASFAVAATRNQIVDYAWFYFGYQWFHNGTNIPGATNATLIIENAQAANAGDYFAVAANSIGSVTSRVARLAIQPTPPIIVAQPVSQAAFPGFGAGFSVALRGSEPFFLQWQRNGVDLAGATNSTLIIPRVGTEDAGWYHVTITNEAGVTVSADGIRLELAPVAAWGLSDYGQTNLPLGLTDTVQIAACSRRNIALRRDGTVVNWGMGGETAPPWNLNNAVAVAAGNDYCLALRGDGTVTAWGLDTASPTRVPPGLGRVAAIAAGGSHCLALKWEGTVAAWGSDTNRQCRVPAGLSNIVAIAAGEKHSVALRADGRVFAWGDHTEGQTNAPTGAGKVVAIAAGKWHSLALKRDGTVTAWGANTYGQTAVPPGLTNVAGIAAGSHHSLALLADGTMVGWGAGLSDLTIKAPHYGQSMVPPGITNITALAGGEGHTLALASTGAPYFTEPPANRSVFRGGSAIFRAAATGAWPLSYQWRLGGTNLPDATNQVLVIPAAGNEHAGDYQVVVSNRIGLATSPAAALTIVDQAPFIVAQPASPPGYGPGGGRMEVEADGSLPMWYQWQFNGRDMPGETNATLSFGQFTLDQSGDYTVTVSNLFGQVTSKKTPLRVAQVVAWGAGTNRTSGQPNLGQSMVPRGLDQVVQVAAGEFHSLALRSDGTVVAWGAGTNYQPNSAYYYGQSIVPPGLSNVVSISAGAYHSLALKSDGTVVAWGAGTNYNTTKEPYGRGQSMVPADLNDVVAISAGEFHSAAVKRDGRVVIWGSDRSGLFSVTTVPSQATNVVAISSSRDSVIALKADNRIVVWGGVSFPMPESASNIVAVSGGQYYRTLLKSDGTVLTTGTPTPKGLSNVVAVATGQSHFLALKNDGTVVLWGNTNSYNLAQIPAGLTNVVDISAGYYHNLAALGNGAPRVKVQPLDHELLPGGKALLTAMAVGAPPLQYQWQLNGTDLPGATNNLLGIGKFQTADGGEYRLVISNPLGSVTSRVAKVSTLLQLGQAVEGDGLSFMNLGGPPWRGQTEVNHDGIDAAQSGPFGHGQYSSLQTTVVGPGTLSFWWKVSSEPWFDYLGFSMDEIKEAPISGEVDWQLKVLAVPSGSHLLRWTYSKDTSTSSGRDAAWLDEVRFVPDPPLITTQPLDQSVSMGEPFTLNIAAAGSPPLGYQWLKDGTNLPRANLPLYTVSQGRRRDAGVYSAVVTNLGGAATSACALVRVRVPQQLTALPATSESLFTLTSKDADNSPLEPGDLPKFQAQASTNLLDWTPLTNGLGFTNGTLFLLDGEATRFPARFFRLFEP